MWQDILKNSILIGVVVHLNNVTLKCHAHGLERDMPLTKIDIGAEIGKGWKLFQPNMGVLILAGVLSLVVSAVTCGLLAGPLMAGMFLLVRRLLLDDPIKPQAGDIFKGFDFFVQSLIVVVLCMVAIFLLAMIPVLGQLAGFVISSLMMWAILFVAVQKLTAIDAFKKVFALLQSGDFTLPFIFGILSSLISGLGVIACFVGILFTLPFAYCMMTCCYETLFGCEPQVIEPEVIPPPSDLRL